ncbi:Uncharacterized protein HBNXHr_1756 [Halorhabdus sp. BNX81]|nr:Uncharacterized protein HBNXHr_1756 [Halorhabdus sp. BNX81]
MAFQGVNNAMNWSVIDRFRRPEYTGRNRCLPCTITNGVFGLLIGNAAFVLLMGLEYPPTVAVGAFIAVIAGSAVQIWLRGYLIPGTPTLTKRYFPPRLLRAFGKEPFVIDGVGTLSTLDVDSHLREADAVASADNEDRYLTDGFTTAWRSAIDELSDSETTAGTVFDLDGEIRIAETDRSVTLTLDGRPFGRWVSRAALLADLGAGQVLANQYGGWTALSTAERGQVVSELRRHLDICPACGGETSLDTQTATSCCREYEVETVSCDACGVRLSESPVDAAP